MKRNFFALLMLPALVLSLISFAFANAKEARDLNRRAANRQSAQLAARLPASDGAVIVDMQRLMKDALPQLLSGRIQIFSEINSRIEQIKNQIGIDLSQFEQVAVGLTIKESAPSKFDFEPLVLARGRLKASALLTAGTLAARGKFREEKAGARAVYVFALKEILQASKPAAKTPKEEEDFNQMLKSVPAEIAASTLDDNTLVIGLTARVRETIEGKSRISQNVLSLAQRKPNSIVSFGANVPAGISRIWKLEQDPLGKSIDSIRQIAGAVDIAGGNAAISLIAKTALAPQAKDLHETLQGFQELGVGLLSGMRGEDKKVYARLAQTTKITRAANEVMLELQISQSDLNVLLGKK